MAEDAPKYDPERQASLTGVAEGLATEDDAAVLGAWFGTSEEEAFRLTSVYSEAGIQAGIAPQLYYDRGIWYVPVIVPVSTLKAYRETGIAFSIMGLLPSIASTLAYSLPAGPAGLVWASRISLIVAGRLLTLRRAGLPRVHSSSSWDWQWQTWVVPCLPPVGFIGGVRILQASSRLPIC